MSQFGAPRILFSLNTNENSETHSSFPCTHVHTQLGGFHNCTPTHATFSHVQSLHHTAQTSCAPRTSLHPRVMSHPLLHTSSPSLSSTSLVLLSSSSPNADLLSTCPIIHCEDPRQDGTSTEYPSSTGYERKRIELNRILVKPQNQTIDDQDDIEKIGLKKVVLQPISSRLGRKHCDAARLGPRRRAIT